MPRPLALILAAATTAGALVGTAFMVSPAGASTASASPHIVAHPDSIMVNRTTKLTGTHFPAKTTLTIEECSETNWIAPQDPCDSSSSIQVKTNGSGRFTGVLTVHTCPASPTPVPTPGFSQKCYVGEPTGTGVDTLALVGAVAITVTGP